MHYTLIYKHSFASKHNFILNMFNKSLKIIRKESFKFEVHLSFDNMVNV